MQSAMSLVGDCNLKQIRQYMAGYHHPECQQIQQIIMQEYSNFDKEIKSREEALIKQFWKRENSGSLSPAQRQIRQIDYNKFLQNLEINQPLL